MRLSYACEGVVQMVANAERHSSRKVKDDKVKRLTKSR
jgi:hypothetical protein